MVTCMSQKPQNPYSFLSVLQCVSANSVSETNSVQIASANSVSEMFTTTFTDTLYPCWH